MPSPVSRRHVVSSLAAIAVAPWARAQAWPGKPVRIVVPFAAGRHHRHHRARAGARVAASAFGQPFVVDNKPGAGGNIGADRSPSRRPTATRC